MKAVTILIVAAVTVLSIAPQGEAAIGCSTVATYLSSCIPYVTDKGPLSGGCCGGIKNLYSAAKTTADRQSVCSCLKSAAGQVSSVNYGKAAGLPGQCGVSIPYKISPSFDCSKVQ